MRASHLVVAATGAALLLPTRASAQSLPPVPLDSRVRVVTEAEPAPSEVGWLRAWDGSALLLEREDGHDRSIPLSDVARLELSEGTHGHTVTGLLIGFGVGLATSAIFAATTETDYDFGYEMLMGTIVFAVPATGVGALVGALIRTERWEEVPLNRAPETG